MKPIRERVKNYLSEQNMDFAERDFKEGLYSYNDITLEQKPLWFNDKMLRTVGTDKFANRAVIFFLYENKNYSTTNKEVYTIIEESDDVAYGKFVLVMEQIKKIFNANETFAEVLVNLK